MAYKMKGFSGFKPSPAKVSDEAVVAAQDKLDHVELDYRTPGWAKAVGKVLGKKDKPKEVKTPVIDEKVELTDKEKAANNNTTTSGVVTNATITGDK